MKELNKILKKRWYKDPTVLTILVAIFGVLVTIIIWRFPTKESDFSISVTPVLDTIQPPGKIQATIEIKSINGYNFPVSLTSNMSNNVKIEFIPNNGNPAPGYKSAMMISAGTEIQEGRYIIEIIGNGADGKEHICKYNLSIVTPPPPPPNISYNVYNDFGIAPGDIQIWSGKDLGKESPKLVDGNYVVKDAPEGNKCFAITSGSGYDNYVGWGLFLGIFKNHKLVTPHTIDLSDYNNLQFWIKSSLNLKVELQEKDESGRKSSSCFTNDFGFREGLPNVWQRIVIPKNSFRNVDIKQIWCPFMITGVGSNITFLVDNVAWIP
jgi:hypothetical protein